MFSGLNLAFFSLSRLRLEAEAGAGNAQAVKILAMRQDSNFLLTTILWGNVGINVLLALLSNSVMAGVLAFLFSTFVITFAGEIRYHSKIFHIHFHSACVRVSSNESSKSAAVLKLLNHRCSKPDISL